MLHASKRVNYFAEKLWSTAHKEKLLKGKRQTGTLDIHVCGAMFFDCLIRGLSLYKIWGESINRRVF